jgi:uncharacterized membrane protein
VGETVGRSIALLAGVLIVLLIIFAPAHAFFHTALDVGVYQDYTRGALAEPMSLPREYPPLAAGIFVLPHLLSADHYLLGFALLAALAAWLTILAVDRLGGGGWWLLSYLALGAWGTLFFRYDIVVVLLTVLAFASATRRHWLLSQVLLAVAVALKLYPLILMPLVVLWQWQSNRRLPVSSTFGGVLSIAITTGSMWLIAPAQVGGMVSYHADRPLEIESTGASLAWLLGPTAIDRSIGSVNLISTLSLTSLSSRPRRRSCCSSHSTATRSRAGSNRPTPGRSP